MATAKSVNMRRDAAIERIAAVLGAQVAIRHRDSALAEALTLEAIAGAVEDRLSRPDATGGAQSAHTPDLDTTRAGTPRQRPGAQARRQRTNEL